jgi:hypothetical protein
MDYDGDGSDDLALFNSGAWHFFNDDGSYLKGIWVSLPNGTPLPAITMAMATTTCWCSGIAPGQSTNTNGAPGDQDVSARPTQP